jgi:hypothetical protein
VFAALSDAGRAVQKRGEDVTDEEEREYARRRESMQNAQMCAPQSGDKLNYIWQSSNRLYGAVPFFASYMLTLH